ncbi:hypothetical protein [Methylobacterium sp. NFXW15]|uniref:hypothetical protein n=1 Tax=Methylobacterium sp. NFXW15 TaxID=2819512 RepID=UPI003CF51A3F
MSIESWMKPEEVADLAAHASAVIDAALVGTDLSREAYWAAVRKGYNTPYNDPPRRRAAPPVVQVEAQIEADDVSPVLVAPAVAAAELRAAELGAPELRAV